VLWVSVARVPDVRMGAPTGSGIPRCGCGAGRVTAARPRAWTRRPRPTPRPLPPTGIHKLYERVVASYLKNAHLEEGDKRVDRAELGALRDAIDTILSWPDSVRGQIAQWLRTDAATSNGAGPGRLSRSHSNRPPGFKPGVGESAAREQALLEAMRDDPEAGVVQWAKTTRCD
jgi:hypothetical protein